MRENSAAVKKSKVEHIGIAVKNLEESLGRWAEAFGLKTRGIEEIKERGVKVAHLSSGEGPSIELVAPNGEGLIVEKFLKEKGEGIHHICFEVDDLKETMKKLKERGAQFVQDKPYKGAGGSLVVFIHPRSFNGVLVELKEKAVKKS